jgi:hypothetical protein
MTRHIQAAEPCKASKAEPQDREHYMDDRQESEIRRRGRFVGETEVEKWNRLFSILFPTKSLPTTPCEYGWMDSGAARIILIHVSC